jgi:hypothetical protein
MKTSIFDYILASGNITELPFNNDPLLINLLDNCNSAASIIKTNEMISKAVPRRVVFDSSGFAISSASKNNKEITFDKSKGIRRTTNGINLSYNHLLTPITKIEARNLEIIPLDNPIETTQDTAEQQIEFARKLNFNLHSASNTAKYVKQHCPNHKLLIPIQCYDMHQLDKYLKAIDGLSYDGLAFPTRNMNLIMMASFLIRFFQAGIKRVHILGINGFFKLGLSAFMARHFFDDLTVDGCAWKISAKVSKYILAGNLQRKSVKSISEVDLEYTVRCNCSACKGKSLADFAQLEYPQRRKLLAAHNAFAFSETCRMFFENASTIDNYESYLRNAGAHKRMTSELVAVLHKLDMLKNASSDDLQKLFI